MFHLHDLIMNILLRTYDGWYLPYILVSKVDRFGKVLIIFGGAESRSIVLLFFFGRGAGLGGGRTQAHFPKSYIRPSEHAVPLGIIRKQ